MTGIQIRPTVRKGYLLLVMPLFLILLVITGIPLLQALYASFHSESYGVREWIGLRGYRFVLEDAALGMTINITLLWGACSIIGTLCCSYFLAEKLCRPGRKSLAVYAALLPAWVIPIFISVPLWRALLYGNGGDSLFSALFRTSIPLTSSPAAAFVVSVIVSIWLGLPFPTLVIYSNLRKINKALVDSAILDGCGRWEINRYIYLPSLREPSLALIALSSIGCFKEFSMMFLLTAGGPPIVAGITDNFIVGTTTTVGIFLYQTFSGFTDYGITAVFGMFLLAGVLLIMVLWAILRIQERKRRWTAVLAFAIFFHVIWFRPLFYITIPVLAIIFLGNLDFVGRSSLTSHLFTSRLVVAIRRFSLIAIKAAAAAEIADIAISLFREHWFRGFNPVFLTTVIAFSVYGRRQSTRSSGLADAKFIVQPRSRISVFYRYLGKRINVRYVRRAADSVFRLFQEGITWFMIISSVLILYLLVWLSFSRGNVCSYSGFIPPFPSGEAFIRIFSEYKLHRILLNTLLIALPVSFFVPILVIPGSYALSRMNSHVSDRLMIIIQTLGTAGGIHTLIPLFAIVGALGLLDTRIVVIIIYAGHGIPRSTLILKAFFQDIPHSLYEAAALEGCRMRTFIRKILFPLSVPAVITIMMTSFLAAWNGFLVPLLFIGSEDKFPISITLYRLVGSGDSGNPLWSLFAATAIVNLVIVGLLFFIVRKPLGKTSLAD